jgi:hypothetical protein
MKRREFLKDTGRYAVLAGLAYFVFRMFGRRSNGNREQCINEWVCRPCGALSDCGLPQALSFKQARSRGKADIAG